MAFLTGVLAALGTTLAVLAVRSVVAGRRFRAHSSVFHCHVRTARRDRRRRWGRWPLHGTRARWVHDVLVLQSGLLGLSTTPHAARIAAGAALRPVSGQEVRGLGGHPWALLLSTEDGDALDVAVAEADRTLLVGPYLVAALRGLPSAPHEQGG